MQDKLNQKIRVGAMVVWGKAQANAGFQGPYRVERLGPGDLVGFRTAPDEKITLTKPQAVLVVDTIIGVPVAPMPGYALIDRNPGMIRGIANPHWDGVVHFELGKVVTEEFEKKVPVRQRAVRRSNMIVVKLIDGVIVATIDMSGYDHMEPEPLYEAAKLSGLSCRINGSKVTPRAGE